MNAVSLDMVYYLKFQTDSSSTTPRQAAVHRVSMFIVCPFVANLSREAETA